MGETVTASVLASRRDSSPVINWPLIIRILNRFWIGQLNTTTGLKPQRAELLDDFCELLEVVDEESHLEMSRLVVRSTKDRGGMDGSHDVRRQS